MTEQIRLTEAEREVLLAALYNAWMLTDDSTSDAQADSLHQRHVYPAAERIVAARVAQAKAEALREAAESEFFDGSRRFLHERADRIETDQ